MTQMKITDVCEVDVVVIGAGAAGLTAAYQLQHKFSFKKLVILEAKDRVGGRLYSSRIATANGYDEWDLGGQWVSSSQLHVMQLLKDFGVEVYPQFMEGRNKLIIDNISDIRTYSGLIPKLGIFELLNLHRFLEKVEWMAKQIPLENPLDCKYLKEWDNQTIDSLSSREASFEVVKKIFGVAIRTVFGCEPAQMSLLFLLYYAALAGGFNELLDTKKGTAQEFRVKGTMYGVMRKLETAVGAENIKTSDPVNFIQQCDDSTVLISTIKGARYRAKYVVCAIPPHLINQIHFTPPLPFNRQQLNQRMPMGNMIKCLATYKRAFWREKHLSGQAIATAQDYTKEPICATFDATTSSGSPALLGFIAGEQAIYWSQKTQSERRRVVLDYFAAVFGKEAKLELVAYEDKDWSQEDYNGGCPVAVMQPGSFAYFQHALREPFGRVHFAGTETAQKWMGYIDGAVESGIRAAKEIGARMSSWPDDFVPNKISRPSSIFNRDVAHSSSNGRRILGALAAGVLLGVGGYFCFKKFR